MTIPITVCFACNDNYAPHAAALVVSMMVNKLPEEELTFYCFADNLPENTKQRFREMSRQWNFTLCFVDIDTTAFEHLPSFFGGRTTYVRLAMAELLPKSLEKVLYLDCDMIVTSSLAELFGTDITNKYAAVSEGEILMPHLKHIYKKHSYFCAGMVLFNLTMYRQEQIEEKAFAFAEEYHETLLFPDQDILNCLFGGNVVYVPLKWNCVQHHRLTWFPLFNRLILYSIGRRFAKGYFARLREAERQPGIVHYSLSKPWDGACNSPRQKEYWKYAKQTPFYDRLRFPNPIFRQRLWRNILNILLLGSYPIVHYVLNIRKR